MQMPMSWRVNRSVGLDLRENKG